MLAAVVGGGLQGVEAAYLALKAGWEVAIIDKKTAVPAARLGHVFLHFDVTRGENLFRFLPGVNVVIPALEDDAALSSLENLCRSAGIPFAYDPGAYLISSSKIKSDLLFARLGIPVPLPWPESEFPLVVKPGRSSGSKGVKIIRDLTQLKSLFPQAGAMKDYVLQEYVEGPSYSLEIMGVPGNYKTLQVTDLEMDDIFDCKRVTAPTVLAPALSARFAEMSQHIARAISLKGIMDVEAILHRGELKVLEIDARLPSQTPITVYWSTGFNMVSALADIFIEGGRPGTLEIDSMKPRGVVFEHIKVSGSELQVGGEHIIKEAGPLRILPDFFGADEAIGDYSPTGKIWVATLIVSGRDREEAWDRRNRVIRNIRQRHNLEMKNNDQAES